mgnify:CR=1 FL=1
MTAFKPFSPKQMQALTWWCPGSPHSGKSGIICDGAVRSGKTLCMSISFVSWAFYRFRDTAFARQDGRFSKTECAHPADGAADGAGLYLHF